MNLGIDPRHADQMVRGVVGLPNGTGKTVRVGVFARGAKAEEAKAAGADVVGADDLAALVQEGKIEFDRCIATPDMMGLVGRLGKVLGPRGLMPNPKLGTVTMDVKGAVTAAKAGQVEFRAEKAGHRPCRHRQGVASARKPRSAMCSAFVDAIQRAKPTGAKGTYLKKVAVSSTMGPGVKVDVASAARLSAARLTNSPGHAAGAAAGRREGLRSPLQPVGDRLWPLFRSGLDGETRQRIDGRTGIACAMCDPRLELPGQA